MSPLLYTCTPCSAVLPYSHNVHGYSHLQSPRNDRIAPKCWSCPFSNLHILETQDNCNTLWQSLSWPWSRAVTEHIMVSLGTISGRKAQLLGRHCRSYSNHLFSSTVWLKCAPSQIDWSVKNHITMLALHTIGSDLCIQYT